MQVKHVLVRSPRVRRDAVALQSGLARDARGGENEPPGEQVVMQLAERDDVPARHDEHVDRRRLGSRVESDDVVVLEPDRLRLLLVRDDAAEHAVG